MKKRKKKNLNKKISIDLGKSLNSTRKGFIMTNEVAVFNFETNEVRTVMIDQEAWFVGKDVATVLGYKNTKDALLKHVDDEDRLGSRITTSGQAREMVVINESGVYSLIFGSKLESAKRFKKWVTSEVLPSIRKTGGYQAKQLSAMELIKLQNEAMIEVDERVSELEEFKKDYDENRQIDEEQVIKLEKARKRRVMQLVGGKDTQAYKEFYSDILRNKVYPDFRNKFNVARYRSLKIKYFDKALKFLETWEPQKETKYAIEYANQMELDL